MVSILITYLLVAIAVMMYAGVGTEGVGLGNPDNSENVFRPLATPVLGGFGGLMLFLAIFASSIASLQTTFLPAARTMLAMGSYGAFPRKLATIHPRYLVPTYATVVSGVVTGVFYAVVKLLSDRALLDTIAALGIRCTPAATIRPRSLLSSSAPSSWWTTPAAAPCTASAAT